MKTKIKTEAGIKSLLIGAAAGMIFFLLSSLAAAMILTKSDLSYHTIKYTCFAVTVISGFLAGFIGRRGARIKGIVAGALSSLLMSVLIVCAVMAVNGFSCSEEVFLLLPAGVFFGMFGGIVSSNLR